MNFGAKAREIIRASHDENECADMIAAALREADQEVVRVQAIRDDLQEQVFRQARALVDCQADRDRLAQETARLKREVELHWKTRRTLVAETERLKAELRDWRGTYP